MNSAIQHFHFEPGTLIAYDGYEVVVTGPVKGGVAVRDRHIHPDENVRYFVLSDEKVHALLLRHDVVIDAEFSSDAPDDPGLEEKEIAFEDQTPEVRHVAFQKEAFCLAARSVLSRMRDAGNLMRCSRSKFMNEIKLPFSGLRIYSV